jgi:hypothetical protein
LRQHTEGAVDGRQGDRTVEVDLDLGSRNRAARPSQGVNDFAATPGETDRGFPEPSIYLLDELRDGRILSTFYHPTENDSHYQ